MGLGTEQGRVHHQVQVRNLQTLPEVVPGFVHPCYLLVPPVLPDVPFSM